MQALQVQATIAMDREQAQSHESKELPPAKPLDFEVTLPDMSKVINSRLSCARLKRRQDKLVSCVLASEQSGASLARSCRLF